MTNATNAVQATWQTKQNLINALENAAAAVKRDDWDGLESWISAAMKAVKVLSRSMRATAETTDPELRVCYDAGQGVFAVSTREMTFTVRLDEAVTHPEFRRRVPLILADHAHRHPGRWWTLREVPR